MLRVDLTFTPPNLTILLLGIGPMEILAEVYVQNTRVTTAGCRLGAVINSAATT